MLTVISSACTAPEACPTVGLGGVRLSVVDAASGASLADAATVSVKRLTRPEASAVGSITAVGPANPLELTRHAEGTYEIVVTAAGYATWQRRVEYRQGCTTRPVYLDLEARLEKAS